MLLLGLDIGSSSVKVSIVDASTGKCVSSAHAPQQEMKIKALKAGWAEQTPELWWENLKIALKQALNQTNAKISEITAIGISYQMHGLVVVDKNQQVLRPSLIWCDSRAVQIGEQAFQELGNEYCLSHFLNSPGNFTASKLKWVKENEPALFDKIWKIMLPGDYIAMKLSGEVNTTTTGLSEGILWDFKEDKLAESLLDYYGIPKSMIPEIVPTFGIQSEVSSEVAKELGIPVGTKICYRSGDQPNNAFSLHVLNPGEVATTAGTSGVVYGVSEKVIYDAQSRVNPFAHVNHTKENIRLGVLLCINGTGILNSWTRKNLAKDLSYDAMNDLASKVSIGSDGVQVIPFGNGSERILANQEVGASIHNFNFNVHESKHLIRAAQEGIAFSFKYGMNIMNAMGIQTKTIKAGKANMFLSPVFRNTLAGVTGALIELYDTDGAQGAARGAGFGVGYFKSFEEAFVGLEKLETIEPNHTKAQEYADAYEKWDNQLNIILKNTK